EDISVAIIFIPIIILTCREIKINPTPFLLGMTICINLASTLTPFGSAENVMIANHFDLSFSFFVTNFGPFFVIATGITLWLLDKTVLSKELEKRKPSKEIKALDGEDSEKTMTSGELSESNEPREPSEPTIFIESIKSIDSIESLESACSDLEKEKIRADPKIVRINLIGLGIFVVLLVAIPHIHVAGIMGLLVFVFLNPRPGKNGKMGASISHFFTKVDYKLVFFFMCLFVLVGLMELNGTVTILETLIEDFTVHNVFLLSIVILIITSLMSGFMDNAPVTIIFLPIIDILLKTEIFGLLPLLVAFVLGVNLGGNFLPQGSAADMMTLELAQQNNVEDLTYKKLTKVGGSFALLHVVLGIVYLAFIIYVYPGF
ncbi:MAG: SLC13 family permease, partial [Promethearchaeota archaeon]